MFIVTVVAQISSYRDISLSFKDWSTIPIQCAFSQPHDTTYGGLEVSVWCMALSLVMSAYYSRISSLYSIYGPAELFISRRVRQKCQKHLGDDASNLSMTELLEIRTAVFRAAYLASFRKLEARMSSRNHSFPSLIISYIAFGKSLMADSFITSLGGVAFSLTYGVAQLVQYRWVEAPLLDEDSNSMGFGQIMAVFLLVLPPLAAVESYYGILYPPSSMSPRTTN